MRHAQIKAGGKKTGIEGGAHLCPLSVGLDHEDDTGVGLIQRVSVQQSLARHAQLHFGHAGCRTAEAGSGRGGLLDLVHSGPSWEGRGLQSAEI